MSLSSAGEMALRLSATSPRSWAESWTVSWMIRLITSRRSSRTCSTCWLLPSSLAMSRSRAETVLVTESALANSSRSCSSRDATTWERRLSPVSVPRTSGALVSSTSETESKARATWVVSMSWVSRVSCWKAGTTFSGVVVRERGIVVPESSRPEPSGVTLR